MGTKLNPSLENDQEHLLDPLEHRDMRRERKVTGKFFSLSFSKDGAEHLSLPLCFMCDTSGITVQFFLSCIIYI